MRLMVHRYIILWLAFFRNSLSRDMEFKMNFIGNLFIDTIFYGSLYFFFSVIFSYVDSLGDFSRDAVIIFLIITYLTDTVFLFFFGSNTFQVNRMVVKNNLNHHYITLPVNISWVPLPNKTPNLITQIENTIIKFLKDAKLKV